MPALPCPKLSCLPAFCPVAMAQGAPLAEMYDEMASHTIQQQLKVG
jgi:hypothetical protein